MTVPDKRDRSKLQAGLSGSNNATTDAISGADEGGLPSAVISLRIIEALVSSSQGMGVTQIAQAVGMPKARVHRHLAALREHGYVIQDHHTTLYRAGWQLFMLGRACVKQFDLSASARPIMERLRDKVGQTIVLGAYDDSSMVVIDVARGLTAVEITLRQGTRFALNATAQGKVMLAYGNPDMLAQLTRVPLERSSPLTITDQERLKNELALVQKRGWADAPEELFIGVNALAAPLFRSRGEFFGTLAIVGSIHYLPASPNPEHLAALLDAAKELSTALGDTRD